MPRVQLMLPFAETPATPDLEVRPAVRPPAPADRVEFVRTPRARRYVIRVRPDGTLRVTVPRRGSRAEALRFVDRQRAWIERERTEVAARREARRVVHGASLLLRGSPATIQLEESRGETSLSYGGRRVAVPAGARDLAGLLEQDLRRLAREELVPRLRELAAQHGLAVTRVTVRNQRSRWGSCSRAGAIALNYRLVQVPPKVRDYVLLHELMHLKQQNHSPRFWRLVHAACPAFREAERWLRREGKALL